MERDLRRGLLGGHESRYQMRKILGNVGLTLCATRDEKKKKTLSKAKLRGRSERGVSIADGRIIQGKWCGVCTHSIIVWRTW